MISLALLIAAAAPQSAIEAERQFATMAQTQGMWTAFRSTAADEALMFVPQPTNAQQWLKDRRDPARAHMWWPAEAYASCDGNTAVTTGPSLNGKQPGYFTTIWSRQPDGTWKWLLDHGDTLERPRPAAEQPRMRTARCSDGPAGQDVYPAGAEEDKAGSGKSADGSLLWGWKVSPAGDRSLVVHLRDGRTYEKVLEDRVTASGQ